MPHDINHLFYIPLDQITTFTFAFPGLLFSPKHIALAQEQPVQVTFISLNVRISGQAFFRFRLSILKPSKTIATATLVNKVKMRKPMEKMATEVRISVMDGL